MTMEKLKTYPVEKRKAALEKLTPEEREALFYYWAFFARPNQLPPEQWGRAGCYLWIIRAGRGWGKTRTGAETFINKIQNEGYRYTSLCAATASEVRDIQIKGESGILQCCPPWFTPEYRPSEKKLLWPNGAVTSFFYGSEPELSRGAQSDLIWFDELHKYRYPSETYDNLILGLRLGNSPLALITSTPKPTKLCREIESKKNSDGTPSAVVTIGKTADNRRNLSPVFFEQIITRYRGSRLGLQELDAEILDDNPYALFKRENIERDIVECAPPPENIYRIIVAVDPAITANPEASNHNGIIVLAEGKAPDKVRDGEVQHTDKKHYYVLEDASLIGPPEQWGAMARIMTENYQAGTCLYEDNQGGLMVKLVLQTAGVKCDIKSIHAVADKGKRALNASLISAQGRLHLVRDGEHPDRLADIEGELTTWIPGEDSPDRMDAVVHGINHCEETANNSPIFDDDTLRFFHGSR
jgi:phage terminase large subunit-like protein